MTVRDVAIRVADQFPQKFPLRGVVNAINSAIQDILGRGYWTWQQRESQIAVRPAETLTGAWTLTNGSASATWTHGTPASAHTVAAQYAGKLIRFAGYNEVFRVTQTVSDVSTGAITLTLDFVWPHATPSSTVAAEAVYWQYALPSDCESVVSVEDTTNGVYLDQRSSTDVFSQRNARGVLRTSLYTWQMGQWGVGVDGSTSQVDAGDQRTITWANSTDQSLAIQLYPEPSSRLALRVYYYYRPAAVTGPASTVALPDRLLEPLVEGVTARMLLQNNREAAVSRMNKFSAMIDDMYHRDQRMLREARVHLQPFPTGMYPGRHEALVYNGTITAL